MKILDLVPLVRRLLLHVDPISAVLQGFLPPVLVQTGREIMTSVREQVIFRRFLRRNTLQRKLILQLQILDRYVHNRRIFFRGKIIFREPREVEDEELWQFCDHISSTTLDARSHRICQSDTIIFRQNVKQRNLRHDVAPLRIFEQRCGRDIQRQIQKVQLLFVALPSCRFRGGGRRVDVRFVAFRQVRLSRKRFDANGTLEDVVDDGRTRALRPS